MKYSQKTKSLIFFLFVTSINLMQAQKAKDSLFNIWNNTNETPEKRANVFNRIITNYYLGSELDSAYSMAKTLEVFIDNNNLSKQKGDVLITYGNIESVLGDFPSSTNYFIEALTIYQNINDKKGEAAALNNLGRIYNTQWNFNKGKEYFEQSLEISKSIKDTLLITTSLLSIGNIYQNKFKSEKALEYYKQALFLDSIIKNKQGIAITYLNMGSTLTQKKGTDKSTQYILKGLELGQELNNLDIVSNAYHMLTATNFNRKQYKEALVYGKVGLTIAKQLSNKRMIKNFYMLLYEISKKRQQHDSALNYLEEANSIDNVIAEINMNQQLQKLEIDRVRMRDSIVNTDKEKEVALEHEYEIKQKNTEKRQLAYGLGGGLLVVTVIAFLLYKNTKRKQLIAEQEKEIEIQQKEKILKDLELSTIDAMIQGQEKERVRLAADLHDSVGATLSAAKLQFDYLIQTMNNTKTSDELIKKTSTLLEDAYVEIRSMSHLKNSGVMAKNGLLPAVEKLSKNASVTNGITFEVQSFGLEQRLENSLEITIFRIIQELVTNVIKHANASKGVVHLTNHEDNLNIMIEDNGIGFNSKQISKTNDGMGINSIDKRVENLDGTLTIESEKNKGTTIIIDIPL